MLALECEAKVAKGQDHQAFTEAFRVATQACPPESCGALLYPLQILTSDVPSAAIMGMLATTQLWTIADRGLVPAPPTTKCVGDSSTTSGQKMLAPFFRPRCTHPERAKAG